MRGYRFASMEFVLVNSLKKTKRRNELEILFFFLSFAGRRRRLSFRRSSLLFLFFNFQFFFLSHTHTTPFFFFLLSFSLLPTNKTVQDRLPSRRPRLRQSRRGRGDLRRRDPPPVGRAGQVDAGRRLQGRQQEQGAQRGRPRAVLQVRRDGDQDGQGRIRAAQGKRMVVVFFGGGEEDGERTKKKGKAKLRESEKKTDLLLYFSFFLFLL